MSFCYLVYHIIFVYIEPHLKELVPRTACSAELIWFNWDNTTVFMSCYLVLTVVPEGSDQCHEAARF